MRRFSILTILAVLFAVPSVAVGPLATVTLEFETQAVDLDTGLVSEVNWILSETLAADLRFAYHAGRTTHAVLVQNEFTGVEISFLDATPFELITDADIPVLTFSQEFPDQPFDADDTVVLKTDTGAYFKVGNALENDTSVQIDYQLLAEQVASAGVSSAPSGSTLASLPALPVGLPTSDWQKIESLIKQGDYRILRPTRDGTDSPADLPEAKNPAHHLRATFAPTGVSMASLGKTHDTWTWNLTLEKYGYGENLDTPEPPDIVTSGNRIEYRRGALVEWYINDERGLEQGFTLSEAPPGHGHRPLRIQLGSSGSLVPTCSEDQQEILLAQSGGEYLLRYGGLVAWDATGKNLPARMTVADRKLILEVDDQAALYPVTVDPTTEYLTAKLLPNDGSRYTWFGYSVSLSGDTVFVGAPANDGFTGAVYVFVRQGEEWIQQGERLVANDFALYDRFGYSVSLWGEIAVIGSMFADGNMTNSGAAYVFVRSGETWSQQAKLVSDDGAGNDRFGVSVSVWGDMVLVGANGVNSPVGFRWSGAAYTFVRVNGTWTQEAKLPSFCLTNCFFGGSVSLSRDTAIVGYTTRELGVYGAVRAYIRNDGVWSHQQELTPNDSKTFMYGFSVSLSGDTALVGSPADDDNGYSSGSVYVFARSNGAWSQQAKLLPNDGGQVHGAFGSAVSLSGDTALVGAMTQYEIGSAYLFARTGTAWAEQSKLLAWDGSTGNLFGIAVGLSGDTAVVGASGPIIWPNRGAAYTFGLLLNEPPACSSPALVEAECAGATTMVLGLDGSASSDPDDDPLSFLWSTDCPGGSFDDATSATPSLTTESALTAVCGPLTCSATLTVTDDGGESDTCVPTTIEVRDTLPPTLSVDTTPITVTDIDCSGDEPVTLPTATAVDQCGPAPSVGHDAPTSFAAGQTTTVTYAASDECANATTAGVDVTVLFGADTTIRARRHIVGPGTYPGSNKEPLTGIEVCAYDKSETGCARTTCGGVSHHQYQCILDSCMPVNGDFNQACCTTDVEGQCTINGPPGEYLFISGDPTGTTLSDPLGGAGELSCGVSKRKFLQQIVRADGKKMPGKTTIRTGSELLIIEPEFVEWDETQESYPVVFESIGEWSAESAVTPPEGFVSDFDVLAEQIDDEVEAVQFLLTDVGSDWVPTTTRYALQHQGRNEVVLSRIGVRLSESLAASKGLDRSGHPLGPDGRPQPHQGFDPRGEWPAELVGWIEPSATNEFWVVKLVVSRETDIELSIRRGQIQIVESLAEGLFEPGEYAFTWDGSSVGPGQYFLSLTAGPLTQKVKLADLLE